MSFACVFWWLRGVFRTNSRDKRDRARLREGSDARRLFFLSNCLLLPAGRDVDQGEARTAAIVAAAQAQALALRSFLQVSLDCKPRAASTNCELIRKCRSLASWRCRDPVAGAADTHRVGHRGCTNGSSGVAGAARRRRFSISYLELWLPVVVFRCFICRPSGLFILPLPLPYQQRRRCRHHNMHHPMKCRIDIVIWDLLRSIFIFQHLHCVCPMLSHCILYRTHE